MLVHRCCKACIRANKILRGIFVLLCFFQTLTVHAQVVKGKILSEESGEPLVGAQVVLEGTTSGAYTDYRGEFRFKAPSVVPFNLIVTLLGFEPYTYTVENLEKTHRIRMLPSDMTLEEVEITSQGRSEIKERVDLTIETLNLKAIQNTTEASFYEGLTFLREVDMLTVSFGFKVVNTRGFNSSTPIRSLQLIDGIDNASPGLNYPLGNFVGLSDLDVEGVDLVIGASSVYFGPGAFNGVISMRTKDPFVHQGLEVLVKGGERDYRGATIRYAKAFGGKNGPPKWAFKINGSYEEIYDWEADDRSPSRGSLEDSVFADNPGGYDAVNRYGDEIEGVYTSLFEQFRHPGLGRFYRTGYWERDLADYNSYNAKLSAALHYKPRQDWEIKASSSYGQGTTVMQLDNRLSLNNIWVLQNRFQIKQDDKFFLRFYNTEENAGDTYDIVTTAYLIQERWRGNGDWLDGYKNYWFRNINPKVKALPNFPELGGPPDFFYDFDLANQVLGANPDSLQAWHDEALASQNSRYLSPESNEFQEIFDEITSIPVSEGGTRYIDRSKLYHVHGEYRFKPGFVDELTVGGNFRWYRPDSEGTIFSDTSGLDIKVYEFGAYLGIEERLIDERLKLNLAARIDKTKNYDYLVSPVFSASYRVSSRHQMRASLSSALRNPNLIEQYYYFRVGNAILLGNLNGYNNLITQESFEEYLESPNLDTTILVRFNEDRLVPEKVIAGEIAYDGIYLDNKLVVNATYYLNRYRDFIGYKIGLQVPFFQGFPGVPRIFRFSANAQDVTFTTGFSTGVSFYPSDKLTLTGNYSWNRIIQVKDDPLIPAYNTPEHKFNLGVSGNNFKIFGIPNWNAGLNFRWVGPYRFDSSPQFSGEIPAQYFINAQISKVIPQIGSMIKIAGSNLLNRQQNGLYGGPNIGRFVYVAWGFRLGEGTGP